MHNDKDFDQWNEEKKVLHADAERLFFHEREIWYCHLGNNIGFEQDGRGELFLRPVVIIRKFNNEIFWCVPLTRTLKDLPFYFAFAMHVDTETSNEQSAAVLSQIRLIDAKRLRRLVGYISEKDFALLKKKLKALLP